MEERPQVTGRSKHAILPQFSAIRPVEDEGRGDVLVSQEESAARIQVFPCSRAADDEQEDE